MDDIVIGDAVGGGSDAHSDVLSAEMEPASIFIRLVRPHLTWNVNLLTLYTVKEQS